MRWENAWAPAITLLAVIFTLLDPVSATCGSGTYSVGSECFPCPAGYMVRKDCKKMKCGLFRSFTWCFLFQCPDGTSTPIQCDYSSYSIGNQQSCTPCANFTRTRSFGSVSESSCIGASTSLFSSYSSGLSVLDCSVAWLVARKCDEHDQRVLPSV
jgi:hypothetical protein